MRITIDPQAGDLFTPSYYALIDAPNVPASELSVCDFELYRNTEPYRDSDFVLYSIMRTPDGMREDISQLPFYGLWQKVQSEATGVTDDSWKNAKALMATLYQTLITSPDLTPSQAETLTDQYVARMEKIHDRALEFVRHSSTEATTVGETSGDAQVRRKALTILDL
jgi:hypothetical protein